MVFKVAVLAALLSASLYAQAPTAKPPASTATAELPDARTIVDRHINAVGGRQAILGHKSMHASGTLSMPANGISGPVEIFGAAPDQVLVKASVNGIGEIVDAYNGKHAWSINPMTGPTLKTGKELEQTKIDADFYSELRDPKKYTLKTIEKTTFDGRDCYKVSVKRADGAEDFDFYDVATGLRAGSINTRADGNRDGQQRGKRLQEVRHAYTGDRADAEDHGRRAEDHAGYGRVRQGGPVRVRAAADDQGTDQVKRFAAVALIAAVALAAPAAADVYKAAETFDAVWTIVRDSHFDPAFDRSAWDRVGAELRPRAIAATTPGELRGVLREMLGRLGLSHFAVIPASPDSPTDRVDLGAEPGFDTRLIDGQLVVTSIEPDGGAAAAGVHTGWIVDAIGGTQVAGPLEKVTESAPPRSSRRGALP
jgi:hypothetical protein